MDLTLLNDISKFNVFFANAYGKINCIYTQSDDNFSLFFHEIYNKTGRYTFYWINHSSNFKSTNSLDIIMLVNNAHH